MCFLLLFSSQHRCRWILGTRAYGQLSFFLPSTFFQKNFGETDAGQTLLGFAAATAGFAPAAGFVYKGSSYIQQLV